MLEAESRVRGILHDLNGQILQLLRDCPYLKDAGDVANWQGFLARYPAIVCITLAVTLLPNLSSMVLGHCIVKGPLIEMIAKIAKANVQSSPNTCVALSKLSKLRIISTYDREVENFGILSYFAVLPSMRSIHGWGMRDKFNQPFSGSKPSELREMILENSVIHTPGLTKFLNGIKALQKFRCEAGAISLDDYE